MTVTVTVTALLTTALLLLVTGTPSNGGVCDLFRAINSGAKRGPTLRLTVYDSLSPEKNNRTYTTSIAFRSPVLGAMRRLQKEDCSFRFMVIEHIDYGPFLESVNGLAGNDADRTYWELLAENENGTIIRPDVGVGCYIPDPNGHVILKFTKW